MLLFAALVGCAGDADDMADDGLAGDSVVPGAGLSTEAPAPPPGAVPVTLQEWTIELGADSVAAGAISFAVTNAGTVPHAFEVEGGGEEWATQPIQPGESLTMTVNLEPGEYRVYCPIDTAGVNHEARGMVAQLRVQ